MAAAVTLRSVKSTALVIVTAPDDTYYRVLLRAIQEKLKSCNSKVHQTLKDHTLTIMHARDADSDAATMTEIEKTGLPPDIDSLHLFGNFFLSGKLPAFYLKKGGFLYAKLTCASPTHIKKLTIAGFILSEEDIARLTELCAAKLLPYLEDLNLAWNNLNTPHAKKLIAAIDTGCPRMRRVSLVFNLVTDPFLSHQPLPCHENRIVAHGIKGRLRQLLLLKKFMLAGKMLPTPILETSLSLAYKGNNPHDKPIILANASSNDKKTF